MEWFYDACFTTEPLLCGRTYIQILLLYTSQLASSIDVMILMYRHFVFRYDVQMIS